jgi:D-sedoheptulose 7-phosphate isomerase
MSDYAPSIRQYLDRVAAHLAELDEKEIDAIANVLKNAYDEERTIFTLGNGGSAATASHLGGDLNKGACLEAAKKFRVIPLTDCQPWIMALANDLGYERIFEEQLKNLARPGDVVLGFSGSGNSPNVLRGMEYARRLGCTTIGVLGFDGGKLKDLVDYRLHPKVHDMQIVEDLHMVFVHVLMKVLGVGAECG